MCQFWIGIDLKLAPLRVRLLGIVSHWKRIDLWLARIECMICERVGFISLHLNELRGGPEARANRKPNDLGSKTKEIGGTNREVDGGRETDRQRGRKRNRKRKKKKS